MIRQPLGAGRPAVLGARYDGDGTNFAVFSANATQIDLCIFSPDPRQELHPNALPA